MVATQACKKTSALAYRSLAIDQERLYKVPRALELNWRAAALCALNLFLELELAWKVTTRRARWESARRCAGCVRARRLGADLEVAESPTA
jgi:hypothetical protein